MVSVVVFGGSGHGGSGGFDCDKISFSKLTNLILVFYPLPTHSPPKQ